MKDLTPTYAALLVDVCMGTGGAALNARVNEVLSLMRRRGDAHLMGALASAIPDAYERATGERRVTVTLARNDRALVSRLAAALKRPSSQIDMQEDSTLIGGVRVRIGDTLVDASVWGALNQLTSALA